MTFPTFEEELSQTYKKRNINKIINIVKYFFIKDKDFFKKFFIIICMKDYLF